jgi:hypothetical protein
MFKVAKKNLLSLSKLKVSKEKVENVVNEPQNPISRKARKYEEIL